MRLAIEQAREGIAAGQTPFGAVVVRGDEVIAAAHNTVWRDTDPTAHAEVNAIRRAAHRLATIALRECTIFSTCEPCPMCLAAIHWSKIERVVFGARIADAAAAAFHELQLGARELAAMGGSPLRVDSALLEAECRELFEAWKNAARSATY
ncbi:MAG: nucleoside deaminase [Acidobacteria bacterium]|nr:nucleoside deaminase [Acidobacteriota bacterium]